jgi:hypothetical protein
MPRSASTWSYNVCLRLLAQDFAPPSIHADFHESFAVTVSEIAADFRHLLLKSHTLDDLGRRMLWLGAVKAIYTYRDPLDAIPSYMRMFGTSFDVAFSAIRDSVELLRFHQGTGNSCIVSYPSVIRSPFEAIRKVNEYLGLSADEESLARIAHETGIATMKNVADRIALAPPESLVRVNGFTYDRRTLLHKDHIRDGASGYGRAMLSSEQQHMIEDSFPDLICEPR